MAKTRKRYSNYRGRASNRGGYRGRSNRRGRNRRRSPRKKPTNWLLLIIALIAGWYADSKGFFDGLFKPEPKPTTKPNSEEPMA